MHWLLHTCRRRGPHRPSISCLSVSVSRGVRTAGPGAVEEERRARSSEEYATRGTGHHFGAGCPGGMRRLLRRAGGCSGGRGDAQAGPGLAWVVLALVGSVPVPTGARWCSPPSVPPGRAGASSRPCRGRRDARPRRPVQRVRVPTGPRARPGVRLRHWSAAFSNTGELMVSPFTACPGATLPPLPRCGIGPLTRLSAL